MESRRNTPSALRRNLPAGCPGPLCASPSAVSAARGAGGQPLVQTAAAARAAGSSRAGRAAPGRSHHRCAASGGPRWQRRGGGGGRGGRARQGGSERQPAAQCAAQGAGPGSPRLVDAARLGILQGLLEPRRVAPVVIHGDRLADLLCLPVAGRDVDLEVGIAVAVEADLEALDRELLGILERDVGLPLVAQDGHSEVGAEAGRNKLFLESSALVVDEGKMRFARLLLASDNELVVERVHLATPIVHHAADVGSVLLWAHVAAVLLEKIRHVEFVEQISNVLEVADLPAGPQQGVVADFLQATHVLIPGLRTV
mmetsp:Transcript_92081/g.257202  ORF Transcript_92081/g.257202 Transcript_92081/m.257202 type:complete len:313 (-) Transcript_92081:212-1150(-)